MYYKHNFLSFTDRVCKITIVCGVVVVYHSGVEATKGHYQCDIFHPGYKSWIRINDAEMTSIRIDEVTQHSDPMDFHFRVPYLLFYNRSDFMSCK